MSTAPTPTKRRSKRSRISGFFFRGLVTLLPVVLTIFLIVTVYNFIDKYVTGPINSGIYWSLESNGLGWRVLGTMEIDPYAKEFFDPDSLPLELRETREQLGYDSEEFQLALFNFRVDNESLLRDPELLAIDPEKLRATVEGKVPPIVGVGLSIIAALWIGWLVTGLVGRRLVRSFDRILTAIPVVRSVYPYAKQVVEFFLSDNEIEFDSVVALPYPSEGIWSLGFVTNKGLRSMREHTGKDLIAIFVPSSPMPMTGYTVMIEASRCVPIPISVDEALRVTVSGGVIVPPHESMDAAVASQSAALADGVET